MFLNLVRSEVFCLFGSGRKMCMQHASDVCLATKIYNFTAASHSFTVEGGCHTRFIIKRTSNLMGLLLTASITLA